MPTKPLKLFCVVEVDLEAERRRVHGPPRLYNRRQRVALEKLYDLFEAGKWQECLDHVRDKTAFPPSGKGYPETEHIATEVSDILMDLPMNIYFTQAELLRQAREKLSNEELLAECARRGLETPRTPDDDEARKLIRDAAQRLRERDHGPLENEVQQARRRFLCPTCNAVPGAPCRTKFSRARGVHRMRLDLVQAVGPDPQPLSPCDMRGARFFNAAMERPADYGSLTQERQWEIDQDLGILDWGGECGHAGAAMCPVCLVRFAQRFKPAGVTPS